MDQKGTPKVTNKDTILAALPLLSPNDLLALQTVIDELLGQRAAQGPVAQNNPQAWFYEAMAGLLNSPQSYASFRVTTAGKQFIKNAPVMVDFVLLNFEQAKGHKLKAMALMRHCLELLANDLRHKKVPVTRGTLTSNMARISEVFENNYPGYINGGLVGLIQPWK